jgi:transcription-repair coupling factor (superfamily II helicase)
LNAIINSILKQLFEKQNITLKELTTLSRQLCNTSGHGIGRFGVLQKIQVENKTQEAIKLVYNDIIVYVSIHSLHKISKYSGKMGHR